MWQLLPPVVVICDDVNQIDESLNKNQFMKINETRLAEGVRKEQLPFEVYLNFAIFLLATKGTIYSWLRLISFSGINK